MGRIKEVTVFTDGDSSLQSTWSNVPYFFTQTLIEKGIKVNRVDFSPIVPIRITYNRTIGTLSRLIFKGSCYDYFRSRPYLRYVRKLIKKAIKDFPNSDTLIFMSFSFSSAGLSTKPCVLFSDWTYDHYINHFLNRKPNFFERLGIKREDANIRSADMVVPLFPSVSEYMKQRYVANKIHYLGNVINASLEAPDQEIIANKKGSNSLLFVGSPKYLEGASTVLKAFEILKEKQPELELHFVGLTHIPGQPAQNGVHFHGYLNKGVESEREQYYELFSKARLFVNTTPRWAAFSASIEAMYFYTPVLVTPADEFIVTFGNNIDFGDYCPENSPTLVADKITELISANNYTSLCANAHEAVKDFTWSSYIDKLLSKMEDKLIF